jgi:hypothetical protein
LEAEIRRTVVQNQPGQIVHENLSQKEKKNHKKELIEWLKAKALSSRASTAKKKKKERKETRAQMVHQ